MCISLPQMIDAFGAVFCPFSVASGIFLLLAWIKDLFGSLSQTLHTTKGPARLREKIIQPLDNRGGPVVSEYLLRKLDGDLLRPLRNRITTSNGATVNGARMAG